MNDPTCVTPDCNSAPRARGLCSTCYGRLWRSGGIQPELPLDRHSLTEVDTQTATAVCVICGPVKIRVMIGQRGHQCMTVRNRTRGRSRRSGSTGKRYPVTPEARRRWKYKITGEQYAAMVEEQGGRCAICQRPDELKVDHDHSCCPGTATCGKCVRGLLCDWCNRGLGIFRDDPAALSRAAGYLAG